MTLKELQSTVDAWIASHGVRYFNEMTNVALLMEEVGEFSRLIARTHGEQSFKAGTEPDNISAAIADELADILFVLTCLSNQLGLDMEQAMRLNLEKKSQRDFQRHHNNPRIQE